MPTPPSSIFGTPVSVLTQRYNTMRTGANTSEHILTVAAVSSQDFQKLYTIPVNGQVYAQPLLVSQVPFPDGTFKNVLIVATMQDMVFAFNVDDATNGPAFAPVALWSVSIGAPLAANFMPMGASAWICPSPLVETCFPLPDAPGLAPALPPVGSPPGHITALGYEPVNGAGIYNINPLIGIVSTPVVDPSTNRIYVVGKTLGPGTSIQATLAAIDLISGKIIGSTPIGGTFPGTSPDSKQGTITFDPKMHLQRPGLLLQNGRLYIAFGSHQDTPPWHGWVFEYNAQSLQPLAVFCFTSGSVGASVWQAGSGLTADAAGNIYVMTGNGCNLDSSGHCAATEPVPESNPPKDTSFDTKGNFADMFVELNSSLGSLTSVSPSDQPHRETEDLDLGSSGPVLIPGTTSLIGGDKEGKFFVLTTSPLKLTQTLQVSKKADDLSIHGSGYHHIHGTPAVWRSPKGIMVYVWPERDFLRAFHWSDSAARFDCRADPKGCQAGNTTIPDQISDVQSPPCNGCMPGGIVSVSAEGAGPGTGIVWGSLPLSTNDPPIIGGGLNSVVPGELKALEAENISHELWKSTGNTARDGLFMFAKFNPPMVANGRVYLATFGSIPSGGSQAVTGAVNVYGLRQWAKFIKQNVPVRVNPGQTFTGTIEFLNAGTTVWQKGAYRLGAQNPQDNFTWGTNRIDLAQDVHPGETVTLSLSLTAPNAPSVAQYQWRMVQENVEWFGEFTPSLSVLVGHRLVVPLLPRPTQNAAGENTVAVQVTDEQGKAVPGVSVAIHGGNGTVKKNTDSSGNAVFTYLPCTQGSGAEIACHGTASKSQYIGARFAVRASQ